MSRSPRRLLRRAADALSELESVLLQHPDAREELERIVGLDGVERLARATVLVREQAALVDEQPTAGPPPAREP